MNISRYMLGCGLTALAGAAMLRAQQPASTTLPPTGPTFRFMGPSVGNRIASAAGVPGDPTIYYAGAASGGVWKSTDSGATFSPVFDNQPVAAIGALAVAPDRKS